MARQRTITQAIDLPLPHLPAALDRLHIAHLSDLHIRRRRPRHDQILAQLLNRRLDLALLTGDYMTAPGDEQPAFEVMQWLCERLTTRLGIFGVFGNHDSPELRQMMRDLPVQWLDNQQVRIDGLPLEIMGVRTDREHEPDFVAMAMDGDDAEHAAGMTRPIRIMLTHFPNALPMAADLGADIMLCGHTHGGQCRIPGIGPIVNHAGLPLRLTSGILRHQNTLCAVTRGLGEVGLPLRAFCPPQLPVYILRRGPMPGQHTFDVQNVVPW